MDVQQIARRLRAGLGVADGLVPNGDRSPADAGMAKCHALMGRIDLKAKKICTTALTA